MGPPEVRPGRESSLVMRERAVERGLGGKIASHCTAEREKEKKKKRGASHYS